VVTGCDAEKLAVERFRGRVATFGRHTVVLGPSRILGERSGVRLRIRMAGWEGRLLAFRANGRLALVVPEPLVAELGLKPHQSLSCAARVWKYRARALPPDVADELRRQNLQFASIPRPDQRQSLLLIGESSTPEVRSVRTAALVGACERQQ
jgi:hypothetical protein